MTECLSESSGTFRCRRNGDTAFVLGESKRARIRWYQFKLRTLIGLTVAVAVICWVVIEVDRPRRICNRLRKCGARVGFLETEGVVAAIARKLLPREYVDSIYDINFRDYYNFSATAQNELSAECVGSLDTLKGLRKLSLYNRRLTHDAWRVVSRIPNLRDLDISHSNVSDLDAQYFGQFSKLELFKCPSSKFGDRGMIAISNCRAIEHLDASYTEVSDVGVASLSGHHSIECLDLCKTKVSDHSMDAIAHISTLKWLRLNETAVSDEGVRLLRNHQTLDILEISQTQVGDSGVIALCELPRLRVLMINGNRVSEAVVKPILANEVLERVEIELPVRTFARLLQSRTRSKLVVNHVDVADYWLYRTPAPIRD